MFEPRIHDDEVVIRAAPMTANDTAAQAWPAVSVMATTAFELSRQAGWATNRLESDAEALVEAWNPAVDDSGSG
jgi:hypothetical protein